MAEQKIVVISDVHMNNRDKNYSWCTDPLPGHVKSFLDQIATDKEVDELVLAGDFFDIWLYPIDITPLEDPSVILNEHYPDVRSGLEACAEVESLKIYYINGNHDMSITQGALNSIPGFKDKLIQISPEDYQKAHPGLRIEHGHAVDMFNARPEPSQLADTAHGFPIGYFITRLFASTGESEHPHEQLEQLLRDHHRNISTGSEALLLDGSWQHEMGGIMVDLIIDFLSKRAGLSDDTLIKMPNDIEDTSIGYVKSKYHTLLGYWWEKTESEGRLSIEKRLARLLDYMLVSVRKEGDALDWYADEFFKSDDNILGVVFGHTHHSVEESYGASRHYVNDGCWCRKNHPATWLEVSPQNISSSITLRQFNGKVSPH